MELFKLLGTIAVNNSEAIKALDETADVGNKTQSKLSNAFGKIGSAAVKVGKVAAAGIAAGATALSALSKSALESYADYEQLVGGIETLFGAGGKSLEEYAASVGKSVNEAKKEYDTLMTVQSSALNNADNAYKTAGMSVNEYMETITGFAASLKQSLGEEYGWQLANYADIAVTDMADNANKMGTNMELIQNAYQGFAKQNYTMLDNLKLGYGGTKEEMERLLRDAEKIEGYMEGSFDISSFADIVDAIHIVQEELGITGTTAKEASETISGSISTMKASWSNLITGLGNDQKDLSILVDQFVESTVTVVENVIPRIETILNGIAKLVVKIVPQITDRLPSMIDSLLPPLVEGAIALVNGLVQAMPTIIKALMNVLPALLEGIMSIMTKITQALPDIITVIIQALPTLIPMLVSGIMDMIVMLCTMLPEIIQPIIDNLPMIITAIVTTLITCVPQLIEAGVNLMLGLFKGMLSLVASIPQILTAIFEGIVNGICSLFGIHSPSTVMMDIGKWIILGLFEGIKSLIDGIKVIWENLKEITATAFNAIVDVIATVWNGIKETTSNILNSIKENVVAKFTELKDGAVSKFNELKGNVTSAVNDLKEKAVNKFNELKEKVFEKITSLKDTAVSKFNDLREKVTEKISLLKDKSVELFNGMKEKAVDGFEKLKSGALEKFDNLKSGITDKLDAVKNFVSNTVQKLKDFFNFDWKLPHIKLPHFSMDGSFSLNPPSIPHIGVEWYKKAMDAPVIMDKPTAFGINPSGQIMAGGEAGSEVVSGTDTLMNMISAAVAENNSQLFDILNKLYILLNKYLPECANMQMVLDTGTLVGELAPSMNDELGWITHMRGRRN